MLCNMKGEDTKDMDLESSFKHGWQKSKIMQVVVSSMHFGFEFCFVLLMPSMQLK